MQLPILPPIPAAPRDDSADIFHGTHVADPFRPLEKLEAPTTKAWVAAENVRFEAMIAPQSWEVERLRAFLETQQDYAKRGLPRHRGKFWLRNFHDGLRAQGETQIADAPTGPWRTVLDPLAIDPSGNTSVDDAFFTEDASLLAYTLSVGGDDETTLFVMDVATGKLLPDRIEKTRFTHVVWDRDNQGFHYSYPAGEKATRTLIKYHRLGDDPTKDRVIAEEPHPESFVWFARYRDSGLELLGSGIGTGHEYTYRWRMEGEADFRPLITTPERISICELIDGKVYAVTHQGADRGQLVRFDPATPDRREPLIAEHPTDILEGAWLRKGVLFASYTVDTADAIRRFTLDGQPLADDQAELPLPVQATIGFAGDNPGDDGCYVSIGGWLTPGTQYWYDYAANTLTLFAQSDAPETLAGCLVKRVFATSKDGTRVPITIIRTPDTPRDGTAATLLYGYGGFNVALGPGFVPRALAWVREGGIFVQANLRGGGEFGSAWYDGGRKLNKQNVFDDFIACAEWLIEHKYTSTPRLAIEGGSNGGLLTLACMLQRPELFGAVVSQVPVTDLLRFDLHTFGSAWKSDYGDPKVDAADFAAAMGYSPLHNVKPGITYPPHLVLTAERDTRVLPSHAYKFVATMQAVNPDAPCFLRVDTDAGHGAGVALKKTIETRALIMGFCIAALGPFKPA